MIRDFEPRDQDAFREQIQAGMRERWGSEFDPSANRDVDDVWANYVVAKRATVIVAEFDGAIIGTGILVREDSQTGRLLRMSVDARHRRRGIAKKIVRELVARAKRSEMRSVAVRTDTVWVDAVALYRSCGFEVVNQSEETNLVLAIGAAPESEDSGVAAGTPHGFGDDARSRFLRSRPPPSALAWVEEVLGASITRISACKGGSSSAVHALRVLYGAERQTVILRRYVIDELNMEEPDIAEREARVLQFLERCELMTPQLLAVDASGVKAGVPSVLMTRVAGRVDWAPTDIDRWLHELASVLPALHATPVTASDHLQTFQPYAPPSWNPPTWLKQPALWDRAVEMFHQPALDPDRVFIHRDYHPGNVLWRRQHVSGLVDWQAASIGPRSVDVFWCWSNLVHRFDLEIADRFVGIWERRSGDTYHRWAEIVMLVDVVGATQQRSDREQRDLEFALSRSLADFG